MKSKSEQHKKLQKLKILQWLKCNDNEKIILKWEAEAVEQNVFEGDTIPESKRNYASLFVR